MSNQFLAEDFLFPSQKTTKHSHKKNRLVPSPNSFFMDVRCPSCSKIHAKTTIICEGCKSCLGRPSGGKVKLTEGCSWKKKK